MLMLQRWRLEWVQWHQQDHHPSAYQDRVQNCLPLPVQQLAPPRSSHLVSIKCQFLGRGGYMTKINHHYVKYFCSTINQRRLNNKLSISIELRYTFPLQVSHTKCGVHQDRRSRSSSILLWPTDQPYFTQTFCQGMEEWMGAVYLPLVINMKTNQA